MAEHRKSNYKAGPNASREAANLLHMAEKSAAKRAAAKGRREAFKLPTAKKAFIAQVPRGFTGVAGEAKYVDIANAAYVCDTTGSVTHVSIVPQGTTVNTRVGRKCELKYFQMRGHIISGAATLECDYAVYLVWDEQPNKALAAVTDILDLSNSSALSKRENVQRFKILRKWTGLILGNITAPATGKEATRIDEYVRLPNGLIVVPTTADTTGVIGDIITGALLLVTVGSVAPGTGAANLAMTARTGFADV